MNEQDATNGWNRKRGEEKQEIKKTEDKERGG